VISDYTTVLEFFNPSVESVILLLEKSVYLSAYCAVYTSMAADTHVPGCLECLVYCPNSEQRQFQISATRHQCASARAPPPSLSCYMYERTVHTYIIQGQPAVKVHSRERFLYCAREMRQLLFCTKSKHLAEYICHVFHYNK
jgi:hypothetical protein